MRTLHLLLLLTSLLLPSSLPAGTFQLHALTEELPPFSYTENGLHKGFANELLQMTLHEAQLSADIQSKPWSRAYREAQETPNTLLYLIVRTPARENLFRWVGPVLPLSLELFRLGGDHPLSYLSLEDAKQHGVATLRDSPNQKLLEEKGFVAGRNLFLTNSETQSAQLLYARRVGFAAGLEIVLRDSAQKLGYNADWLDSVQVLDDSDQFYFALQKDSDPDYQLRLQKALDQLKQDGRYRALVKRYLHH